MNRDGDYSAIGMFQADMAAFLAYALETGFL